MARIEVSTHIEAPPERVWDVLVDWERQAQWMGDASSVQVRTAHRSGSGVQIRCRTNILGFPVNDDLVVTQWDEGNSLEVRHLGWLIRGVAAFELTPTPSGTRIQWWEEAEVPLRAIGEVVAGPLVVPWVSRVFRRNLAAFKRVCEAA